MIKRVYLLLMIILVGCQTAVESPTTSSEDIETLALGEQVYEVNCASCHGANLEGQANWKESNPDGSFRSPPHDETGHTWHHDDETLLQAIRLGGDRLQSAMGTSNMPAYQDILTEEEITAVLDYIKSTWPDDVRARQPQR